MGHRRRVASGAGLAVRSAAISAVVLVGAAGCGAAGPSPTPSPVATTPSPVATTAGAPTDPCARSPLEDPSTPFGSGAVRLAPPDATPLAQPPADPASDGSRARIETERGAIVVELFPRSAPVATQNFTNLAEAGYYDGVVFHRLVPGFVIQGGDGEWARSDRPCAIRMGTGGPGYTITDEPFAGSYRRGVVAMARSAAPNSQGSQFFIVLDDSVDARLDPVYTVFGRVVEGMDVVDAIAAGDVVEGDQAADPVAMTRVSIERP